MATCPPDGIRLSVLGGITVTYVDGVVARELIAQPKRLALLIYLRLAQPGRYHRRDVLLGMFWRDSPQAKAGLALRQALHFIRRALPEGSLERRAADELRIAPARVNCDAVEFDELLDQGDEAQALSLYAGPLLPGFHVRDSVDFEQWLDMERERLSKRAALAALFVSARHAHANEPAPAQFWARFAHAQLPFDERVLRSSLEILADVEGSETALEVAATAARRFAREMGIGFAAETKQLIGRLKKARSGYIPISETEEPQHPSVQELPAATASYGQRQAHSAADVAFMRAEHFAHQRTPQSQESALLHYHAALRANPFHARSHLGIARTYFFLAEFVAVPAADAFARMRHHSARALTEDPSLAEAHCWLAMTRVCHDWDWIGAEADFRRAIELDPSSVYAHVCFGLFGLTPLGRWREAAEQVELAVELAPVYVPVHAYAAMVFAFTGQPQRAYDASLRALELDEHFALAWWLLAYSHAEFGRHVEAVEAAETLVRLTHRAPVMVTQLARYVALSGDHDRARSILFELDALGTRKTLPYFMAATEAVLGNHEESLRLLSAAYHDRSPHMVFAGCDPVWRWLSGERTYRHLLLRMGLPEPRRSDAAVAS